MCVNPIIRRHIMLTTTLSAVRVVTRQYQLRSTEEVYIVGGIVCALTLAYRRLTLPRQIPVPYQQC